MAGFAKGNLRRVAGRPSLRGALATKHSIVAGKKKAGLRRRKRVRRIATEGVIRPARYTFKIGKRRPDQQSDMWGFLICCDPCLSLRAGGLLARRNMAILVALEGAIRQEIG
jgi:hypothetical protein